MIAGEALSAWLDDREAQRGTDERIQAAARRWSADPSVVRLHRDVVEAPERTPESLFAAARRFMDETAALEALIGGMIADCRADPFFRPPFHPVASEVQDSLLLYNHPDLFVSLGVTGVDLLGAKKHRRKGPASINFTGFPTLMRFVRSGGATLSFWEAPLITDQFVAADAGTCGLVDRGLIDDGEEFVVDGRHQSFVIEHAFSDIVFFQAVARAGCAMVGVEYDSESHQCIGASSTDEASSRLQMMVSLMRVMGRDDAFPLLEEALASPQFYTRWHVMREMVAMDAEAAVPSLRRMAAGDPHPDVRTAARRTLALIEADDGHAEGETACPA